MLSYARRRWRGWTAIIATTLLGTGASLLAPLPLKVLVDSVLGSHPAPAVMRWLPGAGTDHGLLVWVVIAEILVFLAASLIDVASTFLWTIVGQGMVFDLARDVFAKVQRRSLRAHLRHPVGDTIERVAGDTWSAHTVMDELIFTPLHSLVTIVAVAAVLWNLDSGLTLLAFAVAPLMALTPILLGRRMRSLGEEQRQVQGRIHSHVQQTLAGIPVVQSFGQETRQHRLFEQLANTAIRLQTRGALLGGFAGLSSGIVTTLGTGVVLLVGAHAVLNGHLTIGDLLVFANYVGILQGQIGGLTGIYSTLQGARPSIDRVVEVLDAPADVEDGPGAVTLEEVRGEVSVEGVTFGYEAGRPVLDGVSFS
ncbi:MAG TPA: ABC transporter ATP-binding protein, partial [Solirubrobacteraceae bacterium]|nr:ABC transporter ATP-binding protein [Solirubrobacteraceae bacterium]